MSVHFFFNEYSTFTEMSSEQIAISFTAFIRIQFCNEVIFLKLLIVQHRDRLNII